MDRLVALGVVALAAGFLIRTILSWLRRGGRSDSCPGCGTCGRPARPAQKLGRRQ